jgi:molybdopterin-containing oxidoreductase family membrane subunit
MFGQYAPFAWTMLLCNAAIPLLLFVKKLRRNLAVLFVVSIFVNIGMWLERYVIIVSSLSHDFDPANWVDGVHSPTWVEGGITAGSFALFFLLFLLFVRNFPAISMTEMKESVDVPEEADPAVSWPSPV